MSPPCRMRSQPAKAVKTSGQRVRIEPGKCVSVRRPTRISSGYPRQLNRIAHKKAPFRYGSGESEFWTIAPGSGLYQERESRLAGERALDGLMRVRAHPDSGPFVTEISTPRPIRRVTRAAQLQSAAKRAGGGLAIKTVVVTAAALVPPLVLLQWLLSNPQQNVTFHVLTEHVVIVTNVSVVSLAAGTLLARAAIQIRQGSMLLSALAFTAMAGFFVVHALATPGLIIHSPPIGPYGSTVIGVSTQLSLSSAAFLAIARYTPAAAWSTARAARPMLLLGAVLASVVAYGGLSLWQPELVAGSPLAHPALGVGTGLLFLFGAGRQAAEHRRGGQPVQGALGLALALLFEAQVAMALAPPWTLAWWEYHVLMLAAVVLALGAIFVELDRRRGLERFLPAPLVERVVAGDALRLAGERRIVTVAFADLRDSTAIAEKLPADAVVGFLNTYVGALARCVFAQGGMLDKFLGDGVMAIFGILPDPSHGAVAAARSVGDMRDAIRLLNDEREKWGESPVGFGVGINTGEVVLGAVGIPERSDFTAVGDTVNTAARLQELCKEFRVDCVLAEATAERLRAAGFGVRALGPADIRGRAEAMEVATLEMDQGGAPVRRAEMPQ